MLGEHDPSDPRHQVGEKRQQSIRNPMPLTARRGTGRGALDVFTCCVPGHTIVFDTSVVLKSLWSKFTDRLKARITRPVSSTSCCLFGVFLSSSP